MEAQALNGRQPAPLETGPAPTMWVVPLESTSGYGSVMAGESGSGDRPDPAALSARATM
jgi:hypothetical protein